MKTQTFIKQSMTSKVIEGHNTVPEFAGPEIVLPCEDYPRV